MNTLFEDFFNQFPTRLIDDLEVMTNSVPVNIRETEKAYIIDVFAPGMEKSDFKVNVDNSALTISAEKKTETSKETEERRGKDPSKRNQYSIKIIQFFAKASY